MTSSHEHARELVAASLDAADLERVIDDDFDLLLGDSLAFARFLVELEERMDQELDPAVFEGCMSVDALAGVVEELLRYE